LNHPTLTLDDVIRSESATLTVKLCNLAPLFWAIPATMCFLAFEPCLLLKSSSSNTEATLLCRRVKSWVFAGLNSY